MIDLSKSDRDFLKHLRFREAGDSRPCWVYQLPRNRWQLVVWTMQGSWSAGNHWRKNGATLAKLESAGLIEYGPDQYLPAPYGDRWGSEVRLTDAGREAIA